MREIKFRAWDADSEYMFYSDKPEDEYFFEFNIDGKFKAFVIRYDGFVGTIYEPPQPEVEELHDIMQFTNLKDSKGVEIYEGDVVKINAGYGGDHFYKECIAEIKYDAPGFYPHNLNDEDGVVWQDDCYHFKSFEIIGNIYEDKG